MAISVTMAAQPSADIRKAKLSSGIIGLLACGTLGRGSTAGAFLGRLPCRGCRCAGGEREDGENCRGS
jgi:hypothetical protein